MAMSAAPRAANELSQVETVLKNENNTVVTADNRRSPHALGSRPKKMPVSLKKRLLEAQIKKVNETLLSENVASAKIHPHANEVAKEGVWVNSDGGAALPEESEDSDSDGGVPLPENYDYSFGGVVLPEDSENEDSDG